MRGRGPRIPAMDAAAMERLAAAVRSSGLVGEETKGVALCSGGADSSALLAGLAGAIGAGRVTALHLDYGLRPDSGRDAAACLRGRLPPTPSAGWHDG